MKVMKNELLTQVDEKNKDLLNKHEQMEESKFGLEKRINQLERKLKSMDEHQTRTNEELKGEIESIVNLSDPLKGTKELEKKIKLLDQKLKKDSLDMHDDVIEQIDSKLVVIQKERAAKLDRIQKDIYEINKRLNVHDDDLVETAKIIQALDRDRIQDGKTTAVLKQEYEVAEERLDNMAEALLELNNNMNKTHRETVSHNDLNVIKEA